MKGVAILLVVALAAVGGYVALSNSFGNSTRDLVHQEVALAKTAAPLYEFNVEDLKSGVFQSEYKSTMKTPKFSEFIPIDDETLADKQLGLVAVSTVHHGPFPLGGPHAGQLCQASIAYTISLDDETADLISKALDVPVSKEFAHGECVIDLGGEGHAVYTVPAFTFSVKDVDEMLEINFGGIEGKLNFSPEMKHLTGNHTVSPIVITAQEGGKMEMSGMTGDLDMDKIAEGFYIGKQNLKMSKFLFQETAEPDSHKLTIDNLTIDSTTKSNESDPALYDTLAVLGMEKLQIDQDAHGPARIEVGLNKIDYPKLMEISRRLQSQQAQLMKGDPEEVEKITNEMLKDLQTLIVSGKTGMGLKAQYQKPGVEGLIDAGLTVSFAENVPFSFENPLTLMAAVRAAADVSASKPLVLEIVKMIMKAEMGSQGGQMQPEQVETMATMMAQQQLQGVLAQGLVMEEGDNLKISVKYGDGQVLLNGKPMELPPMQ